MPTCCAPPIAIADRSRSRSGVSTGAAGCVAAVPGVPCAHRHHRRGAAATLKLLWTYEAGDAIESSAAIADGVVYVGSQTGDLHAVNLADGNANGNTRRRPMASASRRRRSRGGVVYIGDLVGRRARGRRRDRKGAVDVQDRRRGQIVAGRRRRYAC